MCVYIQNIRCVLHYNMFSRRRFLFNMIQKIRTYCPAHFTIIYTRLLLKWFLLYIISDVRHSILMFEVFNFLFHTICQIYSFLHALFQINNVFSQTFISLLFRNNEIMRTLPNLCEPIKT